MKDREMAAATIVGTFGRLVLVAAATWATAAPPAWAQSFQVIKAFDNVRSPYAPLVQGPDEAFYGTTLEGGAFGGGVVFRVVHDGSAWRWSVIHVFDGVCGSRPWSGLAVGPDGALYGTATAGGSLGGGTVYRLVGSGESWTCELVHDFISDGATPLAGLTLGSDGAFYGTTAAGGSAGLGTVFRLSPSGSSWVHELLYSFDGSHGAEPWGRVLLGPDGALYGTTYRGGTSNQGTIYRLANAGGAWVPTFVHSFEGPDGANPWAGLTLGDDGAFFGTTEAGGSTAPSGASAGTVFRVSGSGSSWTHEVIVDFDFTNGALPSGELANIGGVLYGTTRMISLGAGSVFRLSGSGSAWTHEVVYTFTTDGNSTEEGFYPVAGVIEGADGALYGTTWSGGPGVFGTVFRLAGGRPEYVAYFGGADGWGSVTGLVAGADGALYGTAPRGGSRFGGDGWGVNFRLSRAAGRWTHEVLYDFGPGGFEGGGLLQPSGLSVGGDGALYGTHLGGAAGCGTIFRLAKSGDTWTRDVLHSFGCAPDPDSPLGGVTVGPGDVLYGTTLGGGVHGGGTIFRLLPSGGGWTFETLHEFDPATDGGSPYSTVVFGSDGALYGTTTSGGGSLSGTAFRLAQNGGGWTFQVIHEFTAPTGAGAYGRLALGPDGALYGTTYNGGQGGNQGTVYRLARSGAAWTHEVLAAFGDDPAAGRSPFGGLAIGGDGTVYGTARYGGSPADVGTVFRVRYDGTAWVRDVLHTCTVSDCASLLGDLLVSGRSIYGTAESGGPGGGGVVFRIAIVPPAASVSASSLDFGSQDLGTTSGPQSVTVTNVGGGTANVTNATVTGDFAIVNGCTITLDEDESCAIEVTFTPTGAGPRTGTLTITTDAGGPFAVALSGIGKAPAVLLAPDSLDFGSVAVGSTSGPQTVTLQNTGAGPLTVSAVLASGDFAVATSTCPTAPAALSAGASCAIDVTFTPTAEGTRNGFLTLTDDAPGSPQAVTLTGLGVTSLPVVGIAPATIDFGSVNVGATSSFQAVTVTNAGSGTLSVTGVTVTGDFLTANQCTTPLGAGASCTIQVAFAPTLLGPLSGSLTVTTDPGGPFAVSLSGTGTAPRARLSWRGPRPKGWPVIVGLSSSQTFSLSNSGDGPMTISSIAASGDFAASANDCPLAPSTLTPGASCSITVSFTPTETGVRTGVLTVLSDAADSPTTMTLRGTGMLPLVASPVSLSFPDQAIGTRSAPQVLSLSNPSPVLPVPITSIAIAEDFLQANDCGTSIPAGASCSVTVRFTPSKKGNLKGTLTVTSGATTSPNLVPLSGKGI